MRASFGTKSGYHRSLTKILVVFLIGISLAVSAAYSSGKESAFALGGSNYSQQVPAHLTMVGANQVVQGGPETFSFVQKVSSEGLIWDRESVANTTQNHEDLVWDKEAGIHVLALMGGGDPETSCTPGGKGSGVLRSETLYKSYIQQIINDWTWIHNWEYGNEVQGYWCNIGPQNYFQGLVWAYEVISTTPGHANDTIQGPAETIYNYAPSGVWDGYDGCGTVSCVDKWDGSAGDKVGWFYSFWHENLNDSFGTWTPEKILTYVSLHVYTQQQLFSDKPDAGPYSTVGVMLAAGLGVYYMITGNAKDFVISETGFHTDSGGATSKQTAWYQQMVPFYQSEVFITGVFAYVLYDTQPTKWGLFDGQLVPRPAWLAFQNLFPSKATTTTSDTTTTTSDTTTTTSDTTSDTTTTTISSSSLSSSSSSTSEDSNSTSDVTNTSTISLTTIQNSSTTSIVVPGQSQRGSSTSSQISTFHSKSSRSISSASNGNNAQPDAFLGPLSVLSPSKNPPVADGFAAYEIFLLGGLAVLVISRSRR